MFKTPTVGAELGNSHFYGVAHFLNWSPLWRRAVCECSPRGARGIYLVSQTCVMTLPDYSKSKLALSLVQLQSQLVFFYPCFITDIYFPYN